jgi:hypothetical protein
VGTGGGVVLTGIGAVPPPAFGSGEFADDDPVLDPAGVPAVDPTADPVVDAGGDSNEDPVAAG